MCAKLKIVFLAAAMCLSAASPVPFTWTDVTEIESRRLTPFDKETAFVQRLPSETSRIFELEHGDDHPLKASFKNDHHGLADGSLVKLPVCAFNGRLHTFKLRNSDIIPPSLQAHFPDVRSYHGFEVNGIVSAEITVGPDGIRAQIYVPIGQDEGETVMCYVDPHTVGRADKYSVYSHMDPRVTGDRAYNEKGFSQTSKKDKGHPGMRRMHAMNASSRRLKDASYQVTNPPAGLQSIRTYRTCIALSPDYMELATKKGTTAMALLTTTLTRASGLWRRVLGISLQMCDAQKNFFKSKAEGNVLPNGNVEGFMNACSDFMTKLGVTDDMYDVGHYISASGGGGAGGCCVCEASYKCSGGTAMDNPIGDPFDVDYVAHELGHQFDHKHTFSGAKGQCGSNFYAGESVELGSGRTILGYAGICDVDDLQKTSSPYFSSVSLGIYAKGQHTKDFPTASPGVFQTCGTVKQTTNNRPTATTLGSCAIPKATPFVLKGTGTDPDAGTTLTYSWEQVDASDKPTAMTSENKKGPLFNSAAPSVGGHTRHFPKLVTTMTNLGTTSVDPYERLSSVARDLHFTMTVRDTYSAAGGASDSAEGSWHAGKSTVNVAKAGPLTMKINSEPPGNLTLKTGAVSVSWKLQNADKYKDDTSKLLRNADYSVEYATCETSKVQCTDKGLWANKYGETCATFKSANYCTAEGARGAGWDEGWEPWDEATTLPVASKPSLACCACGGGEKKEVCSSLSDFTRLQNFASQSSFKLGAKGLGQAKVDVPVSLAGKKTFFRVVAGAGAGQTSDIYCNFYAISTFFNLVAGPVAALSVVKSIPSSGAAGVANENLQVAFVLSRDFSLTAGAKDLTILVKNGAAVTKSIKGNSADIHIDGNTVRLSIGTVPASLTEIVVPALMFGTLPATTLSFTTAAAVVAVAPTVSSSIPANGSTGILQTSAVSMIASAPSDSVVVGAGSVHVFYVDAAKQFTETGEELLCSFPAKDVSFDTATRNLSFDFTTQGCLLYPNDTHKIVVDSGVFVNPDGGLSLAANHTISFLAWDDKESPKVLRSSPLNGEKNVSEYEDVVVFYNEDIWPPELVETPPNITIKPRDSTKKSHSLSVNDAERVGFYLEDDFTGVLEIIPSLEEPLTVRTTYDVTIPKGAVEDWSYNVAAEHTFHFTVGDNDAPYCESVTYTQASSTDDLVIVLQFEDWWGQTEPSQLTLGKTKVKKFWLQDVADKTKIIEVQASDTKHVAVSGLKATITVEASLLTKGSTYAIFWPDAIMFDEYDNAVFGIKHADQSYCHNATCYALKEGEVRKEPTEAPTKGPTEPPTKPPTEAPTTTKAPTKAADAAVDKVKVVYTLSSVNFTKVNANAEMKASIIDAVKAAAIKTLGEGYTKDDIEVVLKAGSVVAEVTLTPKAGVTASQLIADLGTKSAAMEKSVSDNVMAVPKLDTALEEGKALKDVTLTAAPAAVVKSTVAKGGKTTVAPSGGTATPASTTSKALMFSIGLLPVMANVAVTALLY